MVEDLLIEPFSLIRFYFLFSGDNQVELGGQNWDGLIIESI
jgi:hypothetical protein